MSQSDLMTVLTQNVHRLMQMTVRAAPAYDQQVGILIAQHFDIGNIICNLVDFPLTCLHHLLVVPGIGRDRTGIVIFLQPADTMRKPFGSGHCPIADKRILIAPVGFPRLGIPVILHVVRSDFRIIVQVIRDTPGGRTVRNKRIRQQNDRSHMLHSQLTGPIGHIETVGRSRGSQYNDWAFSVSSVKRLHQVGLFALGRHTGRRASALHVDDHQR